jgi:hypothetical protein
MEKLRPNDDRAELAIKLIWIVMVLDIISFISGYFTLRLLQDAAKGVGVTQEMAESNDTREQIVAIIYLLAYIFSAVTFILWFRRAYYNLHLKTRNCTFTEGWAAGSWFVPIISLYRPYQIMKELYVKTNDLMINRGKVSGETLSTGHVGWWWTLWIISNLIGQFQMRYSTHADTIDELTISTIVGLVSNIIGIGLAIITVKVIRTYSDMEYTLVKIESEEMKAAIEKPDTMDQDLQ